MNKSELVEYIKDSHDFESKAQAERAVNAVLEGIKDGLKDHQRVQLIGFGTWDVRHREARKGRNPQTGKAIKIPASNTVRFRPGKALKDAVQ